MKKQTQAAIQLDLFSDALSEPMKEEAKGNRMTKGKMLKQSVVEGESMKMTADEGENTQSVFIPKKSVVDAGISRQYDFSELFRRLAQSKFRSSFHLKPKDKAYIDSKGLEVIRQHAADFVAKRLAPAVIPNDGKQTPMRGHPVFLAQHATACCCRGCFYKWHHIPAGRQLTSKEQDYAVNVLMAWITKEYYQS